MLGTGVAFLLRFKVEEMSEAVAADGCSGCCGTTTVAIVADTTGTSLLWEVINKPPPLLILGTTRVDLMQVDQ